MPKSLIIKAGVVFVAVVILVAIYRVRPTEPAYGGKGLGQWLVEVDYGQPEATRKAAREAIGLMGTNALPLVLKEFRSSGSRSTHYLNSVFSKIPGLKFRLATADARIRRAIWAFDALGPAAKPAIQELQGLLLSTPGYVPDALAGIGPDAVPALQKCLTNDSLFYIPGNTIGAIHYAINRERLPESYAQIFMPDIQRWAVSTNSHAAWYATNFLKQFSPAAIRSAGANP